MRFRLGHASRDLAPARRWADPLLAAPVEHDRGPVLVQIVYDVRPEAAADFLRVVYRLRSARLRDGAFSWGVYVDAATPTRYLEHFAIASWLEHLRQHERATVADTDLQSCLLAFLDDGTRPIVTHHIAADPPSPAE
ncbi:MAG: MFS transporter [Tepidisphaeraceae bacterium]